MNTNTLPRKAPTRPSGFVCPSFLNATEQGGGGVGDGVGVDDGGGNVDVDMLVLDNTIRVVSWNPEMGGRLGMQPPALVVILKL